jgi:cytochrome c oxidase subunit 2
MMGGGMMGEGGQFEGPFSQRYSGPFRSNGQRIYFTSESDSGRPITYTWDLPMGPPFLACVNCHGPEGQGGKSFLFMQVVDAPKITWQELTRESDPAYSVRTVERAITQGIDNEGKQLKEAMPRWSLSSSDLADLVGFLKTLP